MTQGFPLALYPPDVHMHMGVESRVMCPYMVITRPQQWMMIPQRREGLTRRRMMMRRAMAMEALEAFQEGMAMEALPLGGRGE